jgi:hypothetical protein
MRVLWKQQTKKFRSMRQAAGTRGRSYRHQDALTLIRKSPFEPVDIHLRKRVNKI